MKGGCWLPPEPSGAPVPQQFQLLRMMTVFPTSETLHPEQQSRG